MASPSVPDFDRLPKVKGMPQGCAWGVFDKDGKKDVMGTLNLLTPDVVKAAVAEVKEGVSVSLKYALSKRVSYAVVNGFPVGPLMRSKRRDLGEKDWCTKLLDLKAVLWTARDLTTR
jgi:hypothetical protein